MSLNSPAASSTASIPLSRLSPGRSGRVCGLTGEGRIFERLRELGFSPGTEIRVERRAPLGGARVLQLRGYQLCLRLGEAALIQVEPLD